MRIGIDARFLGASSYGLAQYSENLITALAQQDAVNEYTVFVNSNLKRKIRVGQNFHIHKIKGKPLSSKGIVRMGMALRREEFDLIHVHFPLAPLASKCPAIITVHDIVPFNPGLGGRKQIPVWDRIGGWFLYPMTMLRARWIICVSHATRQKLVEMFPQVFHKTIVIRSGVEETYRQKTDPQAAAMLREKLKLPPFYILYSGSAGATKNVPRMIEAFANLRKTEPQADGYKFVMDITDDPRELGPIHRAVDRHGIRPHIQIHNGLTAQERHVIFEGASVLFVLSMHEGFCFPAIRAQICGVPVVAADSGALPEVCGEGSLLVNPDNMEEIVTMLSRALFNLGLREYLIDKGQESAARFSWVNTAKEVKQVYELLF